MSIGRSSFTLCVVALRDSVGLMKTLHLIPLVFFHIPLALSVHAEKLPNVVIFFTDDQGYADIGVQGAKGYKTPNIDKMAAEGTRFTDFYVASAVCSASRAALLTGCYPPRVGIHGALGPSKVGLNLEEETIAEVVKKKNYATAMFGKWHLGDHPTLLPTKQGFDQYLGLPYSNDMWPENKFNPKWPPLPLIEGDKVLIPYVTGEIQATLTTRYAEGAVDFISSNKDKPFFLYVAPSMPHVPLYVSEKFKGKTEQGTYGDVIEEIDWAVGEILKAIKENGLDENTLVVFASDNGPWTVFGNHAGSTGPLREAKGTSWEGGIRVPCVMRWPGTIPAGRVSAEPLCTIDLLPTIANLVGAPLPERKIDGKDIGPILRGDKDAKNPHESLAFYYGNNNLEALRSGKWKLIFPHSYRIVTRIGNDGGRGDYGSKKSGLELYDLEADPSESINLADKEPETVKKLQAMADKIRSELGDGLTKTKGSKNRPSARVK
jgi:arylsulfatase A